VSEANEQLTGHSDVPASPDVVVVGAGIAGLTAAFRLQEAGLSVLVLEAAEEPGGKMSSVRRDGFVINRGATAIPAAYSTIKKLAADVGLQDALKPMKVSTGIVRDGEVKALRGAGLGAVIDAVRTDVLSWRSKLLLRRLAVDALRWRKALGVDDLEAAARLDTETVREYAMRRLNAEIYDYVINPLMRAFAFTEPHDISVVDFFIALSKFAAGPPMEYPAGIDFVVRALAARLDVRTSARVDHVERAGDGARVTYRQTDLEHVATARACVIAVCGADLPAIFPGLRPRQAELLGGLPYSSAVKGVFALRHLAAEVPTVIVVPSNANSPIAGALVDSRFMPGSAPPGKATIAAYWINAYERANSHRSDDELLPEMMAAMDHLIPGLSDALEFVHIERFPAVAPVPVKDAYRGFAEFEQLIDRDDPIQLAGDYFTNPGTNSSAKSGERAARLVAERLQAVGSSRLTAL
jgi:protoporphyrinogen/coproporphyrinogen III oxidase